MKGLITIRMGRNLEKKARELGIGNDSFKILKIYLLKDRKSLLASLFNHQQMSMLSGLAIQIIRLVRTATAAMSIRTWFAAIWGFLKELGVVGDHMVCFCWIYNMVFDHETQLSMNKFQICIPWSSNSFVCSLLQGSFLFVSQLLLFAIWFWNSSKLFFSCIYSFLSSDVWWLASWTWMPEFCNFIQL